MTPPLRTAVEESLDSFRDLQKEAWQIAEDHGWHADFTFGDKIALIHSEASEALEDYRDGRDPREIWYDIEKQGKPCGIPVELADIIIRTWDLAEIYGIDLAAAVYIKTQFNRTRPFRHGGKAI